MTHTRENITRTTVAVCVILACALTLRLYHLNTYDLWFDELATDMFSSQNLERMTDLTGKAKASLILDRVKNDPHSSFYFVFIHTYSILFGGGKSLRIFSVLFSMLSLGMLYKLSRLLFDRRTSLYALLIMALNPFHLWYAQEARAYAMACFFSLLMVYVYMQALKTGRRTYWICFPIAGKDTVGVNKCKIQ